MSDLVSLARSVERGRRLLNVLNFKNFNIYSHLKLHQADIKVRELEFYLGSHTFHLADSNYLLPSWVVGTVAY